MPRIINERPINNHIKNDIIVAHFPPVNCNYTLFKGSKTNSLNHNSSYNVKVKNERLQYSTLVIVYRCKPLYKNEGINISIQLLLLFIMGIPQISKNSIRISIQLLLLFIGHHSEKRHRALIFQYNSCYCLSHESYLATYITALFQYNSCYCLSADRQW